jgi:predicted nucleic acid-binding protein
VTTYIDSNALLRLLLNDNPEHRAKALNVLRTAPAETVAVLDAVIVEVTFQLESPLSYGIEREDYLPHLVSLLQVECFAIVNSTWDALELLARHATLDYTDCLLLAHAQANPSHAVLTFDRDLNRELGDA